jgi:signal peptidase I
MEPSLHNQELILVDKWTYLFHAPARGDVIVFIAPPEPNQDFIKRIVGVPGDVVSINNGVPTIDGVTLKEYYVDPHRMSSSPTDRLVSKLVIPPGKYFVLGDNRAGSFDSRSWGLLPKEDIIGRAALVYWPVGQSNDGLLPNVSSVFASLHPPQNLPQGNVFGTNDMLLLAMPGVLVICSWRRKKQTDATLSENVQRKRCGRPGA